MGSTQAAGYAEAVGSGLCSLDAALSAHLTGNHYPPLPSELVGACKRAIKNIESGNETRRVLLPDGMEFGLSRRASRLAPSWRLAEACHLDAFIHMEEDCD